MLPQPFPMGGHYPQSVILPFLTETRGAEREGRKRWGEYKTHKPDAHGGFGKTDGFSKYRINVDCCHPIPEKTDFDGGAGHMYPRALVKYDMTKETLVKANHRRRFKQIKINEVFPLNNPDRIDEYGNPILTQATRHGLDYDSERFYQSTRNQRVFLDHTSEIRKRVAEKIQLKRIEELKAALRLQAFLNPTPELWERYREICSLTYDQNCYDIGGKEDEQTVEDKTDQFKFPKLSQVGESFYQSCLPFIDNAETPYSYVNFHRCSSPSILEKPLKGILKNSDHDTNQFVRPWVEHNLTMAISSWRPDKHCNQRPSRRVRFKDEIFHSMEHIPKRLRPPTPHVRSFFPKSLNLEAREFEEPENIYYDKELCKNISSRLGLPFKSEACKRFHQKYTDPIPDLRDFRIYPRKHFFNGHHTSVLRG